MDLGGGATTKSEENTGEGKKKKNSSTMNPNLYFFINWAFIVKGSG
tara:strand:- start:261 stop:398 length:138 start_codon:yes stop_codon:yes gene_type:complete